MANAPKKPSVSDQVEYNLKEQSAPSTIPLNRAINPEIEAEVNTWIEKNPEKYREIINTGVELLARREVLRRMRREAVIDSEANLILARLKENEILAARVEDKIRNVPEERKAKARVSVAKDLIAKDALSQHRTVSVN
jgi:L-fucose isomerase-like protein